MIPALNHMRTTYDERQTNDDDGRQPIATGHLGDSGDLKSMLKLKQTGRLLKFDLFI